MERERERFESLFLSIFRNKYPISRHSPAMKIRSWIAAFSSGRAAQTLRGIMDNLQQKIIDYVRENEPVSIAEIVKHPGVYRNKFYVIVAPLREQGLLFSRGRPGVYYNQESFSKWMDDGGREILSQRGRAGSEASLKTRREERGELVKVV